MTDLRQTKAYSNYMKSLGWNVEKIGGVYIYLRKILVGYVMKIQRPDFLSEKILKNIEKLAKARKVFQIIIEPITDEQKKLLLAKKYKQTNPFVPSKTILIDTSKSEDNLKKDLSQKTRYNIKIATRNNIKITKGVNINKFSEFWNKCAKERRNFPQTKEITALYKAFNKNASILFAYKNQTLLSGVLLIIENKKAYYMYAASSKAGKKLYAPSLLVWKALIHARKRRVKVFDFEGIYDERFPLPAWKGFSKFKIGFGGKQVEYPGAFTKWRLPI